MRMRACIQREVTAAGREGLTDGVCVRMGQAYRGRSLLQVGRGLQRVCVCVRMGAGIPTEGGHCCR